MFVELATAIENAGGSISAPERFNEIQDVRELIGVVSRQASASQRRESGAARAEAEQRKAEDEIYIPSIVRTVGNKGMDVVQKLFYERFLKTRYEGRPNIPPHTNFIV